LDPEELFGTAYYYPNRSDGAGWLQRAYWGRVTTAPKKVRYTGRRLKCGACDQCKYESSWVKGASIAECGSWEYELEPAVQDNVPTELPQTYEDEKGVVRRYYTDYAGVTRIYYGTEAHGYRYCIRKYGEILNNEDVSCNGHAYVGGGGHMSLGIESGPSRL
jgi:hypothetical protein